ncbi:Thymidylate kinase [Vanrija pseudolonga]|uniref:Thymidylate kinase n=1 Tax=Vanrija pseudolonga TaxID=143232 RepID=A0AAF0YC57_9TREE|nr:Thymidylate kinase [Vanrija pseudolonga]
MASSSNPHPTPRGGFIVLEGLDRTGKSTLARELVKLAEASGRKARLQVFPDRTLPSGKTIDAYLRKELELDDEHVHQLFSENRWECAEGIKRDLADGTWIITDRYAFSGAAYTMAKGLSLEFCTKPDIGLPRPDAVFYLTASPTALAQRGGYGEERYERVEFQTRVKAQFEAVAAQFKRDHGEARWKTYETEGTVPAQLATELYAEAERLVAASGPDVPQLWVAEAGAA